MERWVLRLLPGCSRLWGFGMLSLVAFGFALGCGKETRACDFVRLYVRGMVYEAEGLRLASLPLPYS